MSFQWENKDAHSSLGFFETLSENLLGRPIKPVYSLAGLGVVLGTHVHVCCPVSPSPPYIWDDHWRAGDLMARVKGEGLLEQSLLKMLPSGDTGGCAFSSRAGPGCPGLCSSENSMFKTTLCSSFLRMAADGKAFVGGKQMSWLWPFTEAS